MIDDIVDRYIKLRDLKAKKTADLKVELETIETAMARCEQHILNHLNTNGLESCGTTAGTAYKSPVTSATVADWPALLDWIKAEGAWNMLDRRVNKSAVVQFKDAHDDLPPGVNWHEEIVVRIRRPS
jgi:hypothetical protein